MIERIICLVMGYCFVLFQTGYLYSKKHNVDIKKEGSGNSGSTNVLRVMGVKAGLIVFLGDAGKDHPGLPGCQAPVWRAAGHGESLCPLRGPGGHPGA